MRLPIRIAVDRAAERNSLLVRPLRSKCLEQPKSKKLRTVQSPQGGSGTRCPSARSDGRLMQRYRNGFAGGTRCLRLNAGH